MGLRSKVIVMLLAAIVPIALGFSYYRWGTEQRLMLERRADHVAARISAEPERLCDGARGELERPARPPRGLDIFAYDDALRPRSPEGPAFPADLVEAMQAGGEQPVHRRYWRHREYFGVTAVRHDHRPDCAVALLIWVGPDRPEGPVIATRVAGQTAILILTLILVGLLISAPLVFRLRRLNEAVRRATLERFENPEARGVDEISELADAFASTLEALQTRDTTLKEYIANTTHDLAIPLTVLQHKLAHLRTCLAPDAPLAAEHLETAIEESHYIAALIANMSAAARLETQDQGLPTTQVRLDEIVARVASRHGPIAAQKGVELNWSTPAEPVVTIGDPTLAEQAVSNLVQNAVQYNTAGGHVGIIIEENPEEGFELRVIDDGPGIPEELLAEVVKRGVRSDEARSRNGDGQGFGLSIAARVCDRHGWVLHLGTRDGGGTEALIRGGRGKVGER